MPNIFFRFKKFTIYQDKCAMKVCTDACLFGAWAANKISEYKDVENILDIGAGTGLLSLMLAQKTYANIVAIEINKEAATQASENFNASPWKKRLSIFNTPVQKYETEKKYDLILCNPPFFENDLRSPQQEKNTAKHDTDLTMAGLVETINKYLIPGGYAMIMVPFHRVEYMVAIANTVGLYSIEKLYVRHSPVHDNFRAFLLLSRDRIPEKCTSMSIYDENRKYTTAFRDLLKEYYLAF